MTFPLLDFIYRMCNVFSSSFVVSSFTCFSSFLHSSFIHSFLHSLCFQCLCLKCTFKIRQIMKIPPELHGVFFVWFSWLVGCFLLVKANSSTRSRCLKLHFSVQVQIIIQFAPDYTCMLKLCNYSLCFLSQRKDNSF